LVIARCSGDEGARILGVKFEATNAKLDATSQRLVVELKTTTNELAAIAKRAATTSAAAIDRRTPEARARAAAEGPPMTAPGRPAISARELDNSLRLSFQGLHALY
jgi:hypothetical protein